MWRIIVTGGRDFEQEELLNSVLDAILSTEGRDIVIVHGANPRGADAMASRWAKLHGVQEEPHPADWQTYGKKAGPIRNQLMIDLGADEVVAFPWATSRGTWDCVIRANKAGIRVGIHGKYADAWSV